jgi:hypothetical protein
VDLAKFEGEAPAKMFHVKHFRGPFAGKCLTPARGKIVHPAVGKDFTLARTDGVCQALDLRESSNLRELKVEATCGF